MKPITVVKTHTSPVTFECFQCILRKFGYLKEIWQIEILEVCICYMLYFREEHPLSHEFLQWEHRAGLHEKPGPRNCQVSSSDYDHPHPGGSRSACMNHCRLYVVHPQSLLLTFQLHLWPYLTVALFSHKLYLHLLVYLLVFF